MALQRFRNQGGASGGFGRGGFGRGGFGQYKRFDDSLSSAVFRAEFFGSSAPGNVTLSAIVAIGTSVSGVTTKRAGAQSTLPGGSLTSGSSRKQVVTVSITFTGMSERATVGRYVTGTAASFVGSAALGAGAKRFQGSAVIVSAGLSPSLATKRATGQSGNRGAPFGAAGAIKHAAGVAGVAIGQQGSATGSKRIGAAVTMLTGQKVATGSVKIGPALTTVAAGAFQLASVEKQASLIAVNAASFAGVRQSALALRYISVAASSRIGGSTNSGFVKRGQGIALSSIGGRLASDARKMAGAIAFASTGGTHSAASFRIGPARASVATGSDADGVAAKRAQAAAFVGAAGFSLSAAGLPPLSDIAVIAGLYLKSIGITGVRVGGVTISGVIAPEAATDAGDQSSIIVDGVIRTSLRIEGRRTTP